MHPEYLDYVVKQKVRSRARWNDIRFLCRKLLGCSLDSVRPQRVTDGHWIGWIVEFDSAVDLAELQRNICQVLILGDGTVFIGIDDAY